MNTPMETILAALLWVVGISVLLLLILLAARFIQIIIDVTKEMKTGGGEFRE